MLTKDEKQQQSNYNYPSFKKISEWFSERWKWKDKDLNGIQVSHFIFLLFAMLLNHLGEDPLSV